MKLQPKSIPYIVRVPDGNWTRYLSGYEPQRWGNFDTDDCWDISTDSYVLEVQLNYLYQNNQFSPEAVSFYKSNGFIDANGLFAISERYFGIISKRENTGGDPWWMATYISEGFIPRFMLEYTAAEADAFQTEAEFDFDYFNPDAITPAMSALAKQAASYITVSPFKIGSVNPDLQDVWAYMKQCPLVYTVPIPSPATLWNQSIVPYQGGTEQAHCVGGYEVSPQYDPLNPSAHVNIPIGDNYQPQFKMLQAGYYLCEVVAIVIASVVPNPVAIAVPQNSLWDSIWSAITAWWNPVSEAQGAGA